MEVMADHKIGTQEEWQAERDELLKEEKELTRRGDELARKRRELPWVQVEKDYRFDTKDGTNTLADLFDGRSQLLVYHFMFGPPYEAGCPVCSSIADTLDPQVVHLKSRDSTLLLASRAPAREAPRLQGADGLGHRLGLKRRQRLQSRPRLPTHRGGADAVPGGRDPAHRRGKRALVRDGRRGVHLRGTGPERVRAIGRAVYRTYVTSARGLEPAMAYYGLLDRTPNGRDESASRPLWVRRHDEYETS